MCGGKKHGERDNRGDFNIRIRNLCRRGVEKRKIGRSSKDKCISNGKEIYGIDKGKELGF